MGDPDPGYTAECIGDSLFDNNFSDELSKAEWGLAKDVETKLCKVKDCAEVRDFLVWGEAKIVTHFTLRHHRDQKGLSF